MIKIFDRLNKKKALATFLAVSLMVVIAFWGREVGAEDAASTDSSSKLAMIVSWLIYPFVYFAGFMVGIMVKVMLWIATYNNFLNVPVVESGWVIVRDLCNNAFIIVMLLMALSTVLDQKAYHYKSILPKVIMTAILVNFSKMITGIAIDFSQILLLTFAAPLAQTSGQNILLMALGLSNSLSLTKDFVAGGWGMVVALIVGLLVGTVSFVVIGVIAIMLLARLITLWFLVILSPLYFLSQMIPQLSTISKDWSSKLRANLITGPIMMFFVYLSFATLSGMAQYNATTEEQKPAFCAKTENTSSIMCSKGDKLKNGAEGDAEAIGSTGTATTNVALSKLASPEGILSSMVVIGMLIMSLKMGQDLGAAGAGVAKSVLNKGREFVDNQRKKYLDRAKGVASSTWGVTKGVGVGIDKMAGGHISGTFGAAKSMAKGAALGAAAGSVIPGLGTTAGLLVGAFGNPFTRLGLDKLKLGERLKSKRAQDERLLAASNEGTQTRQESIKANAGGPGKDKEHTYNEKLGGYVFADAGGKKYMLDKNGQSMEANAAGEIPEEDKLKRNITVEAGDRGGMVDKNGQAIAMKEDGSGPIDAAAVRSAYKWNDSARAFIDDDGKVYQKDGKVVQRYNEYTDEKGNRFARGKKDQQYKQIDERGVLQLKNDAGDPGLILTNDGTLINERGDKVKGVADPGVDDKFKSEIAKGTLLGNEITTIGGAGKRFVSAYQASTNKTKNITEEAEDKNISDAMKELKGLNKEMLQNLFDMEKDATKRQAIALQLAIKNGFNSKASMERARDSISNDITVDKFDDEMNKNRPDWANDLTTIAGRLDFYKGIRSGKFEFNKMDENSITENMIKAMKDNASDADNKRFFDTIKESNKHTAKAIKAFESYIKLNALDRTDANGKKKDNDWAARGVSLGVNVNNIFSNPGRREEFYKSINGATLEHLDDLALQSPELLDALKANQVNGLAKTGNEEKFNILLQALKARAAAGDTSSDDILNALRKQSYIS